MAEPRTWQEQVDVLAHGEVHPLLLATDIERQDRLGVHVVLVSPADDVDSHGHASTRPVFSRYFDVPSDAAVGDDEVAQMRRATIADFAARLRELLTDRP